MQSDQQQDQPQPSDQEPGITPNNTENSSQLTSTAGDVTESRDDDVVADRQCAAGLGVEVCHVVLLLLAYIHSRTVYVSLCVSSLC